MAMAVARADRVAFAGDDGLLGAVEIGDPDLSVGEPAGDVDRVCVAPDHHAHDARAGVGGRLHGFTALRHHLDRVLETDGPAGRQGAVLADRVPGHDRRFDAQPLNRVQHHHGEREGRQLGVAGFGQLLERGVEQQAGDIAPGGFAGVVDHLPRGVLRPRSAHPRPLGALAGEHERWQGSKPPGGSWGEDAAGVRGFDPAGRRFVTGMLGGARPDGGTGRRDGLKLRSEGSAASGSGHKIPAQVGCAFRLLGSSRQQVAGFVVQVVVQDSGSGTGVLTVLSSERRG